MLMYVFMEVNMRNTEKTRISIEMPKIEHKKLKALAAFEGVSLKELFLDCIRERYFETHEKKEPNNETLKVIKETEENKNLIYCDDFDDFKRKLGY